MSLLKYLLLRLGGILLVLLLVAVTTFLVFNLLPQNVSELSCGKPCTQERLAEVRTFMGYDQPLLNQIWNFLTDIVTGRTFGQGPAAVQCGAPCFGYSFRLGVPVTDLIGQAFPITLSIAVGAAVLWLIFGVGAGVLSAVKKGSFADRAVMGVAMIGVSTPSYLLALLGILLFGFTLNILPVGGYVPISENPLEWAWHLLLPWTVLAFLHAAVYARISRGQMLEAMGEDYIRTARAKGLRERTVVGKHGLRNVLLPVVTLLGLDLGGLLGGAVISEKIFSMQGLGAQLLDAVGNIDLPVMLGITLFAAFLIIGANFLVDLLYLVLDPRVKRPTKNRAPALSV